MASDTVFLMVPGSFSTIALSEPLEEAMRKRSYEIRTCELLSANDGSRMPPATTADDAASIRKDILAVLDHPTKPQNVVVAAASYGTIPGMSALKGLSKADRAAEGKSTFVAGMAFIAGGMHPKGYAIRPNMDPTQPVPDVYKFGNPGGYMPEPPIELTKMLTLSDVTGDLLEDMATRGFTKQSSASYDGEMTYEAYMDIPSVAIIGEKDKLAGVKSQEDKFAAAKAKGGKVTRMFVEGAGHVLSVSRPEVVADVLVKLAEGRGE